MAIQFRRATKKEAKLRLGLVGPSGTGKTYSALRIARALGERVVVMDSEHGSASKYADEFTFDVYEPDSFNPQVYIDFLRDAAEAGYEVAILDSLSHAWMGKDGALEMVDKAAKRNAGNSFAGWRDVTPLHNAMIEAILAAPLHVIATMRSKTEYVVEEDSRGKKVPRKIGLQPVQRDGMEYEFDVVGDIDHDHNYVITKTRCRPLKDAVIHEPGEEFGETLAKWLSAGEPLATAEQLRELRERARAISARAAEAMEQRIAKGPTQAEAEEWLTKLRETPSEEKEAREEPGPSSGGSSEHSSASETSTSARSAATSGTRKTGKPVPITEPQMKRFWAIAHEAGYKDEAAVKRMLDERFGLASPSELTRDVYEEACAYAGNRELADQFNRDPNQAELLADAPGA